MKGVSELGFRGAAAVLDSKCSANCGSGVGVARRMRRVGALLLLAALVVVAALPLMARGASPDTVVVEPEAGPGPYLRLIQGARHAVEVESYLLTDREVRRALVAAAARGVLVRVIVDRHPYGYAWAVPSEIRAFAGTRVEIRTSPPRFEYDHAKFVVADPGTASGAAILGSSNLTHSGLGGGDREYDVETADPDVVSALDQVFRADWTGGQEGAGPRRVLVLSPGAEEAVVRLIGSARHRLFVESEELGSDAAVLGAIREAVRRGVDVRLVLPASLGNGDLARARSLALEGAKVALLGMPYVHAKLIVADGQAFVGSENLTATSLDRNREVGIVLPVQAKLVATFLADFRAGRRLLP
jgi:cardiolipin synthase